MTVRIWIDGEQQTTVSAEDRGLLYGDGFFTTARVEAGRVLNWARHWQRLVDSAERLAFPSDTPSRMEAALQPVRAVLAEGMSGVLKVIVTRGVGRRGYAPPAESQPVVIVQVGEEPLPPLSDLSHPLTVSLSPVQAAVQKQLAGIKHLNALPYVLAAHRLPPGQSEALMLDHQGHVIGGIQCNVVLCMGRTLYTPEIREAGVWGTTLAALREVAGEMGYQWRAVRIHKAELMKMEAMALLNAWHGLRPVARLDDTLSCRFDPEKWHALADNLNRALRAQAA